MNEEIYAIIFYLLMGIFIGIIISGFLDSYFHRKRKEMLKKLDEFYNE